jgi:hypothetical protein
VTALREELLTICRRIASGEVQPREGAARIWLLMSEANYPPEVEDLRVFVGAVSEMQDHPQHAAEYADDMRQEARAMLEQTEHS